MGGGDSEGLGQLLEFLRLRRSEAPFSNRRNLSTPAGSSSQSCILMYGSRPFMLSIDQGLGLQRYSLTDPCESPKTASPKTYVQKMLYLEMSLFS